MELATEIAANTSMLSVALCKNLMDRSDGISIEEAGPAVHDVTMGSAYGFLVDAFKPQFYMSESIDMLRKLCLVGLVVLFDRGSVVQLLATLCISIAFMFWHVKAWPYKIDLVRRASLMACAHSLTTWCVW